MSDPSTVTGNAMGCQPQPDPRQPGVYACPHGFVYVRAEVPETEVNALAIALDRYTEEFADAPVAWELVHDKGRRYVRAEGTATSRQEATAQLHATGMAVTCGVTTQEPDRAAWPPRSRKTCKNQTKHATGRCHLHR